MPKDAAFYRDLAGRCGEHVANATTQVAREQFGLWQLEFEAQAKALEAAELKDTQPTVSTTGRRR